MKRNILVACECSGTLSSILYDMGHNVVSADLKPSVFVNHYQGDCIDLLKYKWDYIFAFPPCTFLSYAQGARVKDPAYLEHRLKAISFALMLYNAPADKICVENPKGLLMKFLKPTCCVNPYDFGSIYSKRTYLFCKNLPALIPTHAKPIFYKSLVYSKNNRNRSILDKFLALSMAIQLVN